MERRDFLKSLLATALAAPSLGQAKTSASPSALYLISDTPDLFLPSILREISPRLGLKERTFSLDSSHPEAETIERALRQAGWSRAPLPSPPTMSLSFEVLRNPVSPSFTLTRRGKIQDVRVFNLLRLWERMNSAFPPSSLLTIASFPSPNHFLRQGRIAAVFTGGKRVASFRLDKDRIEAIPAQSDQVVIAIEAGQARVVASTCRHQICVSTPPVCYVSERIVCVPRRFLLEVEGPRFVDTVTG